MTRPAVDRFTSRRSTVHAPNGVVATSQPLAAETGVDILRQGGNAFDAAVATAAVLNIVEPTSTGLGGDVFGLYRTPAEGVGAIRSCGPAPAKASIDAVREAIDGESMPDRGPHTVTVPGTARGWERTVETHGKLSLSRVLQPAIEYARDGFPVTEVIADRWGSAESLFSDGNARNAYLVDGERAPRAGEHVRLPALGDTLDRIAEDGADIVYEGEIAREIVAEVQAAGGVLSMEDMAGFEPEFVDPVSTTYGDLEVFELPPNNQGLVVLEALNIASELDAGSYPAGSVERVHRLAEALKLAFHDGHRYITDPAYESVPDLASSEYAAERAAAVGERALTDVSYGLPAGDGEDGGYAGEDADTVLLCVADAEGNVVSYINSRFMGFGSGLVAGETGIALQNRGSSFSLDPDHPNRLEPGKRPFHTLIPAIARRSEGEWLGFGVMGGYMQPQGHLQVLSHLVDDGVTLQAALDQPRWRYMADGRLAIEERACDGLATGLARRGHDVTILGPERFGGGQVVRTADGVLSGATEPRNDGNVTGY